MRWQNRKCQAGYPFHQKAPKSLQQRFFNISFQEDFKITFALILYALFNFLKINIELEMFANKLLAPTQVVFKLKNISKVYSN